MAEQKKNKEKARYNIGKIMHSLMDGTYFTRKNVIRQMPLMVYIAVLFIFSIAHSYRAESKVRRTVKIKQEINELRYEYINSKAKLKNISKQSQLAISLEKSGLKESTIPPFKIRVNKNEIKE